MVYQSDTTWDYFILNYICIISLLLELLYIILGDNVVMLWVYFYDYNIIHELNKHLKMHSFSVFSFWNWFGCGKVLQ
jgi:hypothetical protein